MSDEQLISGFLDKNLNPEQLSAFKLRLEGDPAFAAEVSRQADMLVALRSAERMKEKDIISIAHPTATTPSSKSVFTRWYSIAAAIMLLFIGWTLISGSDFTAPRLADAAMETRRIDLLRTRGDAPQLALPIINDRITEYEQRLSRDPQNADLHFILADLLLDQKQFEAAQKHYQSGLKIRPDDAYANWNQTMLLLAQGNLEQVYQKLNFFQTEENQYLQEKATELQKNLSSLRFRLNPRNLLH
ncbi:MAG: tetratricopeptide repeat protein [Bacteroidota bacterium]